MDDDADNKKDDQVQPPMDATPDEPPPPPRLRSVSFTATSVAVSCLFLANLVAMPLKPYLTEPLPVAETATYRAPFVFPSVSPSSPAEPSAAVPARLKALYNDKTIPPDTTYFYDPVHVVEVMRTAVSASACDDPATLVTSLLGAPFFTQDVKQAIVDSVCAANAASVDSVARSWRIYFGSKQDCLSAAWVVHDPATKRATVYYTYIPFIFSPSWIVAKLSYRLLTSLSILAYCVHKYYLPLWHLRRNLQNLPLHVSSSAVRYEVVVGEPTCLVLSNVWVCLVFVVDFFASTEFFGSACLRMGQTADMRLFFLGVLYLGRTVWCAYLSLAALNIILKRLHATRWAVPANTTTLAIAVTVGGGFLTSIQVKLPPLMAFYTWLLTFVTTVDASGNVITLDDTAAMVVYVFGMIGTCFGIVLGKNYASRWLATRRKQLQNRIQSIQVGATYAMNDDATRAAKMPKPPQRSVESSMAYNDFKHRIVLWLCRVRSPNDVCTGGSVYPLYKQYPMVQSQCTISQTGSDCYVFAYNAADEVVEVTRLSLIDQIDMTQKTTERPVHEIAGAIGPATAVGCLVLGREKEGAADVTLHRGARNSPWVA